MSEVFTRNRRPADRHLMPAAFRQQVPTDTAETASLWRRLIAGDEAAFNPLLTHYLPLARVRAAYWKRRSPDRFADPLDVLVSDACLGLIEAIRRAAQRGDVESFINFSFTSMRWVVRREILSRRHQGRPHRQHTFNVVARVRGEFVQMHGRLPTEDELTAELAGVVTNPSFFIAGPPRVVSDSQAADPDASGVEANIVDTREPDAERRLLDRETIRLALKGLDPTDRKLFRRLLDGEHAAAIASALGLTKAEATLRANGLLWSARCNAKLAAYLGLEPSPAPARHPNGYLVSARLGDRSATPTDERKRRAFELLAKGQRPCGVAKTVGVSDATLKRWRRAQERGATPPRNRRWATDAQRQRADELLRSGVDVREVAALVGVHRDTVYGWQRRGVVFRKVDAA